MFWFFIAEHKSYSTFKSLLEKMIGNIYLELGNSLEIRSGRIVSVGDKVVEAYLYVYRKKFLAKKEKIKELLFRVYLSVRQTGILVGDLNSDAFQAMATYLSQVLSIKLSSLPLLVLYEHFKGSSDIRIITEIGARPFSDDLLPSMKGFATDDVVVVEQYAYSKEIAPLEKIANILFSK